MESTLSKYSLCHCLWQLNAPWLWSQDPHTSSPSILCLCLRNLPKLTKYHLNTNPLRQQQVICQESRFVKLFVVVSILKQKNYSIKFKSKNDTNQPNSQPVTESWKVKPELITPKAHTRCLWKLVYPRCMNPDHSITAGWNYIGASFSEGGKLQYNPATV